MNTNRHPGQLETILVKPAGPDCNLACGYCFYTGKNRLFGGSRTHRMDEMVLEEMIRQVMAQKTDQVYFIWQGGEPTLMGLDFFRRVVRLQEKYGNGMVVGNSLQTNGILLDKEWFPFLREYNFLVGLSLDGPQHVHDHYRVFRNGKGTWNKVVDTAKRLFDGDVAVNALMVVNDYSVRFPEEIYEFYKVSDIDHIQFIPCVEKSRWRNDAIAPFSVPADKYGEFLIVFFELWLRDFINGQSNPYIRFFESLFFRYVDQTPPDCVLLEECGVYLVVEHNGDVYSCDFYVEPEWKLGNILEGELVRMFNSEKQREFGKRKALLPADCLRCEWLNLCRGGCPKERLNLPGKESGSYLCEAYKVFFRHSDKIFRDIADLWRKNQTMVKEEKAVNSMERMKIEKTGRNDPCPCGSGKKYKKCCGRYVS